jgi:hypothetical protein
VGQQARSRKEEKVAACRLTVSLSTHMRGEDSNKLMYKNIEICTILHIFSVWTSTVMTQHKIHSVVAALLLSAILAVGVSAASVTPAPAYSIMRESSSISSTSAPYSSTSNMMGQDGSGMGSMTNDPNKRWGPISSIQNDEGGEPAWILAGQWTMELASQNATAAASNATTNTTSTGQYGNITGFDAVMAMEMFDGTAAHTHKMSNFTQLGTEFDSATNETTITGTSTITLREGPVNAETDITLSNGTVAIEFDSESTDGHFGDTPIRGIIVTPEMMQQFMGMMDHRGGNMTTPAANSTMG